MNIDKYIDYCVFDMLVILEAKENMLTKHCQANLTFDEQTRNKTLLPYLEKN